MGLGFALLTTYGLLAIPFRSYLQPAIIMLCIPFGIVGAVIGHLLLGYSLSVMSMFGVVALSGVVVNDSLVLIDFANRLRRKGESALSAVVESGIMRFRPIMLTTLTTFCGLTPMIFETSRQARFMVPMAISLGFGILFATLIALLLVPCMYMMVEDLRELLKRDVKDTMLPGSTVSLTRIRKRTLIMTATRSITIIVLLFTLSGLPLLSHAGNTGVILQTGKKNNKVIVLPKQHKSVFFKGTTYHYAQGTYYRRGSSGYIIVKPPPGLTVATLPVGFTALTIGGGYYFSIRGFTIRKFLVVTWWWKHRCKRKPSERLKRSPSATE